MTKKAYLIHGWRPSSREDIAKIKNNNSSEIENSGSSEGGWFNWLKQELSKKGFKVISFDMPNTNNPKIEQWINFLECEINPEDIDEETYFIGHSIGCQTILRYLEKLHKHKRIAGCVFVAGWFDIINLEQEELEIAHPWINSKINFNRIKDHTDNFLAIFSNDDPYVPFEEQDKFKNNLGAKIKIKHNSGHFNEINKIPEILEFLR
ncbi:MAG: RBBP9/YdeN family alpha/beta hydrolase [Nanoarchaeota archaeon]